MAASLAGLLLLPVLPQDQSYHLFADCRAVAGIPNFWNVVSNIPFIAIGAAGLWRFRDNPATIVLFLGFFLTGIGSSYYHWNPSDATLFWDRLPMTLCFAAILAAVVEERVDAKAGKALLWPLLAIGIFSLLLWRWTDDLRLYAWAQFFPFLALVLILWLFPSFAAIVVAMGTLVLFAAFGSLGQLLAMIGFLYLSLASSGGTIPIEALPQRLNASGKVQDFALAAHAPFLTTDDQDDHSLTAEESHVQSGAAQEKVGAG